MPAADVVKEARPERVPRPAGPDHPTGPDRPAVPDHPAEERPPGVPAGVPVTAANRAGPSGATTATEPAGVALPGPGARGGAVPVGATRAPGGAETDRRTDRGGPGAVEPGPGETGAPVARPRGPTAATANPRGTGRRVPRWSARAGGVWPDGGPVPSGTVPRATARTPILRRGDGGLGPVPTSSCRNAGSVPMSGEGRRGPGVGPTPSGHRPTGRSSRRPSFPPTSPTSWPRRPARTGTTSGSGSANGWPRESEPTNGSATGTHPAS